MEVNKENIFVNLHEVLKEKRGKVDNEIDYDRVANSSVNVGYLNGEKVKRVIFYLRTIIVQNRLNNFTNE